MLVETDKGRILFIRCNGREFHIELSPFFLCNLPLNTSRYYKFIAVVRDRGEIDAEEEAPDIPSSFDPDMIQTGKAKPLLSEYLFPEIHQCRLESENDKPFPIYMPDEKSEFSEPLCNIRPGLASELEQYVKFFDPSIVEVLFRRPKQALDDMPTRVLADLDSSGEKTTCFFKGFGSGEFISLEKELEAYLRLLKSNVVPEARVVRLLGVVAVEDGRVAGLLLTYVDCRRENDGILDGIYLRRTPIPLRERWASQIKEAVQQLHEGGVVWGDAKADNEKTGTKEGDLQGVERIVEYLFSEGYESASSDDEFDSASE
ncbi:hypothetical protein C8A03DRAFT_48206 [Achaetomium macrosporum]|uniref:Protein kinase domain-containing protein n=1 Tax=Achaetomium macrosporum TaxID=79813 RepID=A0AAN7C0P9_9PEZI|nr:hypothetical protein C8A03DRAFT_48206 [Achaetomium macrosporum]